MCRGFCLLRRLARRDIAPRSDDLQWLSVDTSDQMLLVVHPTIGAIFATEAIFDCVHPVVEELGYGVLDAGEIVGVDAVAPEGWVLEILRGRVAQHVADVFAHKGRRKIAAGLKAVDHRR